MNSHNMMFFIVAGYLLIAVGITIFAKCRSLSMLPVWMASLIAVPVTLVLVFYSKEINAAEFIAAWGAFFMGLAFFATVMGVFINQKNNIIQLRAQERRHRNEMTEMQRQFRYMQDIELRKEEPVFDFVSSGEIPVFDMHDPYRVFRLGVCNLGKTVRFLTCVSPSCKPMLLDIDHMMSHVEKIELLELGEHMTISFDLGYSPSPFEFTIRYVMPTIGRHGWQRFQWTKSRGAERLDSAIEPPAVL